MKKKMLFFVLISCLIITSCAVGGGDAKNTDVGRYQLHSLMSAGSYILFVIDTKTGMTKEVAFSSKNDKYQTIYGNQFGILFSNMNSTPEHNTIGK